MSRWRTRLALAGWLGLGVAAALLTPEDEPPGPDAANVLFGDSHSAQSSGTSGVLALSRTLARFGYDTRFNSRTGEPAGELLVLLEPGMYLAAEEVTMLLEWVEKGGHLIYAPTSFSFSILDDPPPTPTDKAATPEGVEADEKPEAAPSEPVAPVAIVKALAEEHTLDDPLLTALAKRRKDDTRELPPATLSRLGRGLIVVLSDGGECLSNQALSEGGLSRLRPWLDPMLHGVRRIDFDEARLGLLPSEGVSDVVLRSPYGVGLQILFLALLVWFWSRVARRLPAQPSPPLGAPVFAEHIRAVGRVFAQGGRLQLAWELLREGVVQRLGPRQKTERAKATLAGLSRPSSEVALARQAEVLRRLESELTQR